MTRIHPTAVVSPQAELGANVTIGAHAIVGAKVVVGDGTFIGDGAQVQGPTVLGRDNRLQPFACLGFEPQDLKYAGEETRLVVGDRNHFREFCTIHRGTGFGGGTTTVGDDNLFMVYSHVAHDCHVGSRCIFVNNATLGGHVTVHDDATIGAFSAVHQFTRVGRHAYIGGYTVVTMDALPFVKTVGQKPACYGINTIGLKRKGISAETRELLASAYGILVEAGLNTAQALERLRGELAGIPEVDYFIDYVASAKRGVLKARPGRRGARGGGGRGGGEDV